MIVGIQEAKSPYSLNHSLDIEMSIEKEESESFKD